MNNSSLMSRLAATLPSANNGKLLSRLRDALAPPVSSLSLEERLDKLTPEQRQQVLTFAQLARMVALTEVAFKGYSTKSYLDMVRKVYRGGNLTMQQLIADVLEEVAPIEVIKAEPKPEADASKSFYMRDDFKLPSAVEVTAETLNPEPEQLLLFADEDFPEGPDDFLMRIAPKAIMVAQELGIDTRIVAAQAALETGWGKSVKGNNLFGIKSHGKADGMMVQTHEVLGGKRQKITDSFRQYESFDDSIEDYGLFLRENKRYQPMLEAETLDEQITALGKSGYATDPEYAKKIVDIAKSKRLEVLVS
jgi:flagellum-specific peptidoglycan hydrolase FlgJ